MRHITIQKLYGVLVKRWKGLRSLMIIYICKKDNSY